MNELSIDNYYFLGEWLDLKNDNCMFLIAFVNQHDGQTKMDRFKNSFERNFKFGDCLLIIDELVSNLNAIRMIYVLPPQSVKHRWAK